MRRPVLFLALALAAPPAGGATYYVSPSGNDSGPGSLASPWRTIQKAADTLGPGDAVQIRAGTYHERVLPRRSGASGAEIVFSAYPGEKPVLDGTGVDVPDDLTGLFEIRDVGFIRVTGLTVQHSGAGLDNAGFLVQFAHDVVLSGNFTFDTTSSGIGVWESERVTLQGNDVRMACHGGKQESISVAGTSDFDVLGNVVHDGPTNPIGGEGICLKDGSHGGRARGNHVYGLPARLGIYVDAWDKHTYDIEVSGNLVHENGGDGFALSSEMGGLLENVRVFDNVAWGNALRGLTITNYGGVSTHPMDDLLVVNNTFAGNGTSGWGGGIAVDNPAATEVVLRNNLVSGNLSFQIVVVNPAATVDHNLVDGFRGDESEVKGTAYVEGDPRFVNAPAHDYHLAADSPALDRGSSLGAPSVDFDGTARPQGAGVDIGAFERLAAGGCTASATALCLQGSRFRVEASYRDYGGGSGAARAVPLTSDTGYFWFFAQTNVEAVVKLLDFCSVNGRFSVYAAGLTDVEVSLTLTDGRSGATKTYVNPLGTPFVLIRDAPFACP